MFYGLVLCTSDRAVKLLEQSLAAALVRAYYGAVPSYVKKVQYTCSITYQASSDFLTHKEKQGIGRKITSCQVFIH